MSKQNLSNLNTFLSGKFWSSQFRKIWHDCAPFNILLIINVVLYYLIYRHYQYFGIGSYHITCHLKAYFMLFKQKMCQTTLFRVAYRPFVFVLFYFIIIIIFFYQCVFISLIYMSLLLVCLILSENNRYL